MKNLSHGDKEATLEKWWKHSKLKEKSFFFLLFDLVCIDHDEKKVKKISAIFLEFLVQCSEYILYSAIFFWVPNDKNKVKQESR